MSKTDTTERPSEAKCDRWAGTEVRIPEIDKTGHVHSLSPFNGRNLNVCVEVCGQPQTVQVPLFHVQPIKEGEG